MEITIKVLDGAVAKGAYSFRDFPVTIGRRLDNDISISDPSVSRYHCQIVRLGGTLRVVDLGSQNGIKVNDRLVQQEALADGDLLSIGGASLRVQTGGVTPVPKQRGEPTKADSALSGMDTVSVDPSESAYLQATPVRGAGRSERDLWILLTLCRAVGERTTPEDAQIQLIDTLFGSIPAERGAIVLCQEPGAPPISVTTRSRLNGADTFEISRGVLQQVLQEGRAFLRTRIQEEGDAPRTMVVDQVQAALAVPLMIGGRIIGMLYLDTRRPDALFDRGHLDLATAAAATAAASIEGLRRQEVLRARTLLVEAQRREDAELLLLGGTLAQQALREQAEQRALDDRPLLLCGPTGSEGVRLARWIHMQGARREAPLVRVRCDGSAAETLHRELFGDEEAPPGVRPMPLLEAAFGGTVLIHGMQSMPGEHEPRLVQLLETGNFERRAGAEEIPLNARVIMLWEGDHDPSTVRARLGTRLAHLLGAPLEIPSLDDRAGDIPAIAERIARQAARESGRTEPELAPGVAAVLKRSPWPANITQLRAVMERAEAERTTDTIELEDLPDEILESGPAKLGGYHERVFEARRRILLDALERTNGNFSEAAELLEINRTYLHRLIRNLDMKDEIADRFD
jgi:DNA-binding NtrC family response regulator